MKNDKLYLEFENLAQKLGLRILKGRGNFAGGTCIVNDEKVIDYDFPNQITSCKECFTDPIHTNDSINLIIAKEIFSDSLVIGENYNSQP